METPNRWVVIKIPDSCYKVFGTWTGGYLDGDSWQLNSGIKSVEYDDEYFYFNGFSGSVYKCHKECYGIIGMYLSNVLGYIIRKSNAELLDDCDFSKLEL